jgi:tRNA 5-methylaminomethyl-2-thiouridine biosynthesis bifunctional protein
LVIRPQIVIDAWLGSSAILKAHVEGLERRDGTWRMLGAHGRILAEADAVCIAGGIQARALRPDLPLLPVRGQASWVQGADLKTAMSWGGYAAPFDGGLLFGATHDRGDEGLEVRERDHRRNLASLAEVAPTVAADIDASRVQGRAGVRAATPDRMPLAGPLSENGLYVLGGLGSRGFTTAPLMGEHIAAAICAAPSPLPADQQRLVDPSRS